MSMSPLLFRRSLHGRKGRARVSNIAGRETKLTDCQRGRLSWSNFEWPEFREAVIPKWASHGLWQIRW
jgi:hypothetical protein